MTDQLDADLSLIEKFQGRLTRHAQDIAEQRARLNEVEALGQFELSDQSDALAVLLNHHGVDIITKPDYSKVAATIYGHIHSQVKMMYEDTHNHVGMLDLVPPLAEALEDVFQEVITARVMPDYFNFNFIVEMDAKDLVDVDVREKAADFFALMHETLTSVYSGAVLSLYVNYHSGDTDTVRRAYVTRPYRGSWRVEKVFNGMTLQRNDPRSLRGLRNVILDFLAP